MLYARCERGNVCVTHRNRASHAATALPGRLPLFSSLAAGAGTLPLVSLLARMPAVAVLGVSNLGLGNVRIETRALVSMHAHLPHRDGPPCLQALRRVHVHPL